jgi:hypothetical protein
MLGSSTADKMPTFIKRLVSKSQNQCLKIFIVIVSDSILAKVKCQGLHCVRSETLG